ncbi:MAG: hypothetical protein ACKOWF_01720 [Chloroflexota bacterium]
MILNGHAHDFEYFEPRLPSGVKDPRGIAQIVVGTGGPVDPMDPVDRLEAGVAYGEIRIGDTPGILRLTLGTDAYRWEFVGTDNAVLAHGKGTCH